MLSIRPLISGYLLLSLYWKMNLEKNLSVKTGTSGRMDETYINVKGKWHYLYRSVDKNDDTVDFMLSTRCDKPAAKAFFTKSIGSNGIPEKITIDKSGANLAGLNAINFQVAILTLLRFSMTQIHIRLIRYLKKIVGQDHYNTKRITHPTMSLKIFIVQKWY